MWPFKILARRRARAVEEGGKWTAWEAWNRRMREGGFQEWEYSHPAFGQWIEAARREWMTHHIWKSGTERPEMNFAGLWWRPWSGDTIEGKLFEAPKIPLD